MCGMNLPPSSKEPSSERRAVPRHIRDGEHDGWHDTGEPSSGEPAPGRRPRLWIVLVVVAALIAGLWFYNGMR